MPRKTRDSCLWHDFLKVAWLLSGAEPIFLTDGIMEAGRTDLPRRVFEHRSKCPVEFLRAPRLGANRMVSLVTEIEGAEYRETVRSTGNGFILVAGHLGNFGFLGRWLASRGVPSTVVAREPGGPNLPAICAVCVSMAVMSRPAEGDATGSQAGQGEGTSGTAAWNAPP